MTAQFRISGGVRLRATWWHPSASSHLLRKSDNCLILLLPDGFNDARSRYFWIIWLPTFHFDQLAPVWVRLCDVLAGPGPAYTRRNFIWLERGSCRLRPASGLISRPCSRWPHTVSQDRRQQNNQIKIKQHSVERKMRMYPIFLAYTKSTILKFVILFLIYNEMRVS